MEMDLQIDTVRHEEEEIQDSALRYFLFPPMHNGPDKSHVGRRDLGLTT